MNQFNATVWKTHVQKEGKRSASSSSSSSDDVTHLLFARLNTLDWVFYLLYGILLLVVYVCGQDYVDAIVDKPVQVMESSYHAPSLFNIARIGTIAWWILIIVAVLKVFFDIVGLGVMMESKWFFDNKDNGLFSHLNKTETKCETLTKVYKINNILSIFLFGFSFYCNCIIIWRMKNIEYTSSYYHGIRIPTKYMSGNLTITSKKQTDFEKNYNKWVYEFPIEHTYPNSVSTMQDKIYDACTNDYIPLQTKVMKCTYGDANEKLCNINNDSHGSDCNCNNDTHVSFDLSTKNQILWNVNLARNGSSIVNNLDIVFQTKGVCNNAKYNWFYNSPLLILKNEIFYHENTMLYWVNFPSAHEDVWTWPHAFMRRFDGDNFEPLFTTDTQLPSTVFYLTILGCYCCIFSAIGWIMFGLFKIVKCIITTFVVLVRALYAIILKDYKYVESIVIQKRD